MTRGARAFVIVLFVICMMAILVVGWANDVASCERQIPIRQANNQRAHILQKVLLDTGMGELADSVQFVPVPSCVQLLPPTK
jgi:type II secretory pathway component PulK